MDMVRHSLSRLLMPRDFGCGDVGEEEEGEGEWSRQCLKCRRFVAALASLDREREQARILLFSRLVPCRIPSKLITSLLLLLLLLLIG